MFFLEIYFTLALIGVECYENDRIWYPAHGSSEN